MLFLKNLKNLNQATEEKKDKMNKVLEKLDIEYPVIQGAMAGISNSELVATISEVGGLGTLQAALLDQEELEEEIEKIQNKTSNPFAINIPISGAGSVEEYLDIILDKGVKVICMSAGNPKPYLDKINQAKVSMQVVPSSRLAKKMEEYGFDLVVAEGSESGGDVTAGGTSTYSLIPNTTDKVENIPIVAAGGIADKRTAKASLELGAEAVQMGTRFLVSNECQVPEEVKKFIVEKSEEEVITLRHGKMGSNVLMNDYVTQIIEESEGAPEIEFMERFERQKRGMKEGDTEQGIIMAGQSAGLIKEIKPVEEIVKEIGEAILP